MEYDIMGCYITIGAPGIWGTAQTKEYCDAPCGNDRNRCVGAVLYQINKLDTLHQYWKTEIDAGKDGICNIKIIQQQLSFYKNVLAIVQA